MTPPTEGGGFDGLTPPYGTIVADPPWHYDQRVGEFGHEQRDGRASYVSRMPYSTMTLDEIRALSVGGLSRPGAHLYLWTTSRYLEASFGVARCWGFEPVTTLVWCKPVGGVGPGGGRFVSSTEFVLFCRDVSRSGAVIKAAREAAGLSRRELHAIVRGGKLTGLVDNWELDLSFPTEVDWKSMQQHLPALAALPYPGSKQTRVETTWFQWPRGPHSTKPAAFMDMVEQMSPGPYVELFSRTPRLGWDSWGYGFEGAARDTTPQRWSHDRG